MRPSGPIISFRRQLAGRHPFACAQWRWQTERDECALAWTSPRGPLGPELRVEAALCRRRRLSSWLLLLALLWRQWGSRRRLSLFHAQRLVLLSLAGRVGDALAPERHRQPVVQRLLSAQMLWKVAELAMRTLASCPSAQPGRQTSSYSSDCQRLARKTVSRRGIKQQIFVSTKNRQAMSERQRLIMATWVGMQHQRLVSVVPQIVHHLSLGHLMYPSVRRREGPPCKLLRMGVGVVKA